MKATQTLPLKNYRWKGINSNGKKVSGQMLAISEIEVRDKLKDQHIQIKKLKKGKCLFIGAPNPSREKQRHHDFDSAVGNHAHHGRTHCASPQVGGR